MLMVTEPRVFSFSKQEALAGLLRKIRAVEGPRMQLEVLTGPPLPQLLGIFR